MDDIYSAVNEYSDDIQLVQNFCESIYNENFASNFEKIHTLYTRMKSDIHPITDDELEYILTTFPLELFAISEKLNKIRLHCEVIKLKNKQKIESIRKEAGSEAATLGLNKTQTTEYITSRVNQSMIEYELLHSAYISVISRVEGEQIFSKELIMGAKKIWDARRTTDLSNPVGAVVPEYDFGTNTE